jgi:hypothetical protein
LLKLPSKNITAKTLKTLYMHFGRNHTDAPALLVHWTLHLLVQSTAIVGEIFEPCIHQTIVGDNSTSLFVRQLGIQSLLKT